MQTPSRGFQRSLGLDLNFRFSSWASLSPPTLEPWPSSSSWNIATSSLLTAFSKCHFSHLEYSIPVAPSFKSQQKFHLSYLRNPWHPQLMTLVSSPALFLFFFFNFLLFNFTILDWFCHISKWICHRHTCVPHPEPSGLVHWDDPALFLHLYDSRFLYLLFISTPT